MSDADQYYAQVTPVNDFTRSNALGPLVAINMAVRQGQRIILPRFTEHGTQWTIYQEESEAVTVYRAEPQVEVPEGVARALYESLHRLYGGLPADNTQRVLQDALEVERRRVDKVLERAL